MDELESYKMPAEYGEMIGRAVEFSEIEAVAAQLRHAYAHLAAGRVKDQYAFADGLIAPQIRRLETLAQRPDDPRGPNNEARPA